LTTASNTLNTAIIAATNSASVTNWIVFRQPADPVLSNLVGTVARNVTNVVSLSTTNATSKPLTNSYTSGVLTIFGMEQGSGHLLTMNASNIVSANDWVQTASTTNVVGVSNWVNAVSNYVTAATNSAQVTNWITQRQPANAVLSNLVVTVAHNVTNVISLSTTNATSKPLTNSYANGVLTLFGLEEGANITLTPNGSNIVIATSGAVGEANVNGEVSLTNNANGIYGLVYDKVGITNRIKAISAGANIVITNAGTNLWIASTASGGGLTGAVLTNFNTAEHTNWMALDATIKGFTNGIYTDFEKKSLTTGVDRAQTILFHSNMLFVGIQDAAPRLIKFSNPNDLSVYSQTNFFNISTHFSVGKIFYSETKGKLIVYFNNSADVVVYEVDTGTLATNMVVKQLQADGDTIRINDHYSSTTDGTNLWIVGNNVTFTPSFNVAQWRISDWAFIGDLDFSPVVNDGIQFGMPIAYDPDTSKLYSINKSNNMIWSWSAPASNFSNWTARTSTTQPAGPGTQFGTKMVFVGNYGYVIDGGNFVAQPSGGTNSLFRINKQTLEVDRVRVPQVSSNVLTGIYGDGRYIWLTAFTNANSANTPSSLVRFNPATLETDYAEFGSTNNGAWDLTGDGTNTLYAVGRNAPGDVYRIRAPIVNGTVASWLDQIITNGAGLTITNIGEANLYVGLNLNGNQFTDNAIENGALLTNISIRTALTLPTLTVDRAAVINSSGQLTNSATVTTAELEFVDGVTSAIQTQLNGKVDELDGVATNLTVYTGSPALTVVALPGKATNSLQVLNTNGNTVVFVDSNSVWTASNALARSMRVQSGSSASNAVVGGLMFFSTTAFTNLNAASTLSNLANYIVPAHTLTNNGDMVRGEWHIVMASALANTNEFTIGFGSQTILDTGLQIASNSTARGWVEITRTGNTSQHCDGHLEWGPGGGAPFAFTNINLEIVQTNGIDTRLFMQGGARRVGAHTNNMFRVWSYPASRGGSL